MKKLMILAAIVCTAAVTQASAFTWKSYTGQKVYMMNSTDKAAAMTAYLFDSAALSQADVVSAFVAGMFDSLSYLDKTTTSGTGTIAGKPTSGAISWGETGDTLTAYFAIVSGDNIFISTTASGVGQASATTMLQFKGLSTPSQAAAMDATAGFSGAGWYQTVPEPTSGLLMLLGMAGLALRRRRA